MSDTLANPVREAIASDRPAFGCWCTLPTTLSAESLAGAGFDWIIIDLQHGGCGWEDLVELTQAVELGGALPVVRVGWNHPDAIMRALDLGGRAVIVPMIDSADDARRAAAAVRYPPAGIRSYGMARRRYGGQTDAANTDVLCLPMIETAAALSDVEAIAAVPGVDGLFVGPADLGLSLGLGFEPTMRQPEVLAAIDTIVAAARANDIFVGTVASSADHAADLITRGVRFVSLGADKAFVASGAASSLAALRATQEG